MRARRGAGRRPPAGRKRWWWLALLPALPVLQVLPLRWIDPPTSAYMLGREFRAWRTGEAGFRLDYRWRDFEAIAPDLMISLVAAEDQLFPVHRGFDLEAIDAALAHNRAGRRARGASTISQQVAKNLYLWPERNWLRKGLEAGYTVLIEALWPKRRILEVYANIAEFGDGVYGAEAAAQRFFGKPAAWLTPAESARLAAVLPSPRRWSAQTPGPYVLRRAAWIEQQARQLGGPAYLRECCG